MKVNNRELEMTSSQGAQSQDTRSKIGAIRKAALKAAEDLHASKQNMLLEDFLNLPGQLRSPVAVDMKELMRRTDDGEW